VIVHSVVLVVLGSAATYHVHRIALDRKSEVIREADAA
jgi:hypothetical protein